MSLADIRRRLFGRIRTHESFQAVFTSPEGQRVLLHIMKMGRVAKSSFVQGDPYKTAFYEGQRRLALTILQMTCKDHKELQKMVENTINEDENAV